MPGLLTLVDLAAHPERYQLIDVRDAQDHAPLTSRAQFTSLCWNWQNGLQKFRLMARRACW